MLAGQDAVHVRYDSMRYNNIKVLVCASWLLVWSINGAHAGKEDAAAGADTGKQQATQQAAQQARHKQFSEMLHGVKLVGNFTVLGSEQGPLAKEEYTIHSVEKLAKGDLWRFNTRIKYGSLDVPIALNLDVQWAGDTPVITLTNVTIPLLGTFTSRVVLYNQKYAGTWQHGEVGGHLFGQLVKVADKDAEKKNDKKKDTEKKKSAEKKKSGN